MFLVFRKYTLKYLEIKDHRVLIDLKDSENVCVCVDVRDKNKAKRVKCQHLGNLHKRYRRNLSTILFLFGCVGSSLLPAGPSLVAVS